MTTTTRVQVFNFAVKQRGDRIQVECLTCNARIAQGRLNTDSNSEDAAKLDNRILAHRCFAPRLLTEPNSKHPGRHH